MENVEWLELVGDNGRRETMRVSAEKTGDEQWRFLEQAPGEPRWFPSNPLHTARRQAVANRLFRQNGSGDYGLINT